LISETNTPGLLGLAGPLNLCHSSIYTQFDTSNIVTVF
jgi:hypothetical protein